LLAATAEEEHRLQRIRRRTYKTREEARQDVFDYVEMFCNPVRKQVRIGIPPGTLADELVGA
jgi:hypothetical protein